ncbi:DNA cytosine methyltransferase [Mycobacterium sp. M1]|uniref:DNA (cytosine-5-)-methyltransferase n=1 Tax=Mycolicibacter acidiphilus TaxID=2835306 RepID=A0ABS5RLB0_9MYCO|nr:DNA cytosine methyltransferase [Mycolicibacter acidiphilus]MBS9535096.1 DNA cytosine methyltransferase [Mycolicibacter acidiphilus]
MRSVELFAGAGGLALGCEIAGLNATTVVEWDRWACDTIRENKATDYPLVRDWEVIEGDVRDVDWSSVEGAVDVLVGGPPCQPFSIGGKSRMADDPRDMFPATAEVIRQLRPRAFIVENVRGLTRAAFSNYFEYIKLRLEHPEIGSRDGELWLDHLHRLQREHTAAGTGELTYKVVPTLVNAADYGVPQQRWRVFFIGFRSDVPAEWSFPDPSHSRAALMHSQWVTGDYWDRHKVAKKNRPEARPSTLRAAQASAELEHALRPWRTVRDALLGLPEPTRNGSRKYLNHVLQPGARSYPPGHTGSPIDLPAKALKAGDHGVPGGENMLLRPDGSVRYFTVREAARLQTFPERYELHGAWTEAMRQLGNAVPVLLAQKVGASVAEHLAVASVRETADQRKTARKSSRRATA